MNAEETKTELLNLTSAFSGLCDQVQGPGGNTSVKTSDGTMYIKASGFRFEEMTSSQGISAVNSTGISDYFHRVFPKDLQEEEKKMLDIVSEHILKSEDGRPYPKPSMETGFHAVLGKYVVHTHSVWSNLINCASNRLELLEKLKENLPHSFTQLPLLTPGFGLSYQVCQRVKSGEKEKDGPYSIYFLANHGIIAHSDTAEKTKALLADTDASIRNLFGIGNSYPSCKIVETEKDVWTPASSFVSDMIRTYSCTTTFFDQVLFPDQTVFFKDNISDDKTVHKKINIADAEVVYRCNKREACSIHETLTAYLFLHHTMLELKLKPAYIDKSMIDYINTMDMEKFRKGMMG